MNGHKTLLYGAFALAAGAMLVSSCSDWTTPEAEDFYQPPTEEYKANLKNYLQSKDHKVTFGWFGSWNTGSKANQLVGLPDSVDFVSLWLTWGPLTEAQQADLKAFQARGSRAVLCWLATNIGENITPGFQGVPPVGEAKKFWGFGDTGDINPATGTYYTSQESLDSYCAAARKYADAIADTCAKYNIDGFDMDIESWGTLIHSGKKAVVQNEFLRQLSKRFKETGRMLVIDIPGDGGWLQYYDLLEDEVVELCDYICWQTYELDGEGLDNFFDGVKSYKPEIFEHTLAKSIICSTFERAQHKYLYPVHSTWQYHGGLPHAGQGAYHIEYDYGGTPDYPTVRAGIAAQNGKLPAPEEGEASKARKRK